MWNIVLAIIVAATPLVIGDMLNKTLGLKKESARKLIHVLGGLASASLVWLVTPNQIAAIAVVFCIVLIIVRKFQLTPTLYDVKRVSYGELFFPLGVLAASLIAPSEQLYVAVMLIVGFSDTAASIVGQKIGKHRYQLLGASKTLEGSLTFFALTILILTVTSQYSSLNILLISSVATLVEAASNWGMDNTTIPIACCTVMVILV